jgi:hypothetical protein
MLGLKLDDGYEIEELKTTYGSDFEVVSLSYGRRSMTASPVLFACGSFDGMPAKYVYFKYKWFLDHFQVSAMARPGAQFKYESSRIIAQNLFKYGDSYTYGMLFDTLFYFGSKVIDHNLPTVFKYKNVLKIGIHMQSNENNNKDDLFGHCLPESFEDARKKYQTPLILLSADGHQVASARVSALSDEFSFPMLITASNLQVSALTVFGDLYTMATADVFLGTVGSTYSLLIGSLVASSRGPNATALYMPLCHPLPFNGSPFYPESDPADILHPVFDCVGDWQSEVVKGWGYDKYSGHH